MKQKTLNKLFKLVMLSPHEGEREAAWRKWLIGMNLPRHLERPKTINDSINEHLNDDHIFLGPIS